jgi:hypothetical protein
MYGGLHAPSWDAADVEVELEVDVDDEFDMDEDVDVADAPRVFDTGWSCAPPEPTVLVECVVVPVMRDDELLPDAFNVPVNIG